MNEMFESNPLATLYGVGVGPGDPELLTLRARRVIQAAAVIAVPRAHRDGDSSALQVVQDLLRPWQLVINLHFPMVRDLAMRMWHRQHAVETITTQLKEGRDVAFLTEGDPMLYSTFAYVLGHMPDTTPVEIVPGVTSITAAAAEAGLSLAQADHRLAILPATAKNLRQLPEIVALFDTVVLIKLNRTFGRLLSVLDDLGCTEKAVLIDRASHPLGRVVRDVRSVQEGNLNYMSLMILSTESEVCYAA